MTLRLGIAAMLLAGPALAAPPPRQLPPRDTCSSNPSLAASLLTLKAAVARRDSAQLLAMTDPAVRNDVGSGDGKAAFAKLWRLNGRQSGSSRIWRELDGALALGCARDGNRAMLPYYASAGRTDGPGSQARIVIGRGTALRDGPRADAPLIRRLNWEVVTGIGSEPQPRGWQTVETADGQIGFVRTAELRDLDGYRLVLSQRRGKWAITSFAAGR